MGQTPNLKRKKKQNKLQISKQPTQKKESRDPPAKKGRFQEKKDEITDEDLLEGKEDSDFSSDEDDQNNGGEKVVTNEISVDKLRKKLDGARFRWINETLYTTSGEDAFQLFTTEPELFEVYHRGFQSQVAQWPENPVDIFIQDLKKQPQNLVIVDFGCGEAKIAASLKQQVHSFDLVSCNEHVVACDISKVPLGDEVVDVAIFCLSLMGTNYVDYLKEANRVLKLKGKLKVAEVTSRIPNLDAFLRSFTALGFQVVSKNLKNTMFSIFEFTKVKQAGDIHIYERAKLKPCKYKKR